MYLGHCLPLCVLAMINEVHMKHAGISAATSRETIDVGFNEMSRSDDTGPWFSALCK